MISNQQAPRKGAIELSDPILSLLLSVVMAISPCLFSFVVQLSWLQRIEEGVLRRKYGDLRMFRHLFEASSRSVGH